MTKCKNHLYCIGYIIMLIPRSPSIHKAITANLIDHYLYALLGKIELHLLLLDCIMHTLIIMCVLFIVNNIIF